MAETATQLLNYNDKAMRGVSSRAYRTKTPPSNGQSFTMGQTINIDLPAGQMRTFFDFGNSYLRLNLANSDTTDITLEGGNGILNLIKKLEIVVSGQTISSIDNYNILCDMLLDLDSSDDFKNNTGALLMGTGSGDKFDKGITMGENTNQNFAFALLLNPLFNSSKYVPSFSSDSIRIRITLNTAASAVICEATGITDAQLTISDVEMVMYNVELSAEAYALVDESVNGVYDIVVDDYRSASSQVASGDSTSNSVLGFSFSSLNRVFVAFRPQDTLSADTKCSTNRARADLTEINLLKNGESIPARPIRVSADASEVMAELLVADRGMGVFSHSGSMGEAEFRLTNPTGGDGDVGTFMVCIDTESMRSAENKVYTGVNTIGSVVSLECKYDTVPDAMEINVFGQYTLSLSLDTRGTNTFVVAL